MKIAIVKYNAGNTRSVLYALERLGQEATVTDDAAELRSADRVIFPGVGEASSAMRYLREKGLDGVIRSLEQPVLGICLGMQLLCRRSEEQNAECLGVFNTEVKLFPPAGLKVPQMGWNNIHSLRGPLLAGVSENSYCYFVHSYYAGVCADTVATAEYIVPYSAMLQKGNFFGAQFHAEKSAETGEHILRNFLASELLTTKSFSL